MREQDKISVKDLNEMEISNSHDKKLKIMVIIMLTAHRRRLEEQNENVNKEIENIKEY